MYQKITEQELHEWIKKPEDYNLEFKKAQNSFSQTEIYKYTSAIANEWGWFLILGIEDKTKNIIWTKAFIGTHTSLPNNIAVNVWWMRVDIDEVYLDDDRILVFRIPQRPTWRVIKYDKIAWVRYGESCRDMTDEEYRVILDEVQIDESQKLISWLTLSDLDTTALTELRRLWSQETWKPEYLDFDFLKVLECLWIAEDENNIRLSWLLLAWSESGLKRFAPQSEIIIEYRSNKEKSNYDFRTEIKKPFVLAIYAIWEIINARNIRFPFQEGFIQRQVWAYNEKSVREAVINAFVHRDYRLSGWSIYVLLSPEELKIESPGWLVWWITIENILYKKYSRNRNLSDACVMIDLMEKSGQWIDDIFRESISSWKWKPTIWTDWHEVWITLPATLQDAEFVKFVERIENERHSVLPFEAILELENIRTNWSITNPEHKEKLLQLWLIEYIWHGRGTKYILSRKYYQESWNSGTYTKLVWLDRDLKKEYILKYLDQHKQWRVSDFHTLFPEMKIKDVSNLVSELRRAWLITYQWKKRVWLWKKSIS